MLLKAQSIGCKVQVLLPQARLDLVPRAATLYRLLFLAQSCAGSSLKPSKSFVGQKQYRLTGSAQSLSESGGIMRPPT
jgi:hypothetical protein